jgi:hypothetical protein
MAKRNDENEDNGDDDNEYREPKKMISRREIKAQVCEAAREKVVC